MSPSWHILTGEYPPQPGGVSDYCRRVAAALAEAGDGVCVWCPPALQESSSEPGVEVRRCPWRRLGEHLDRVTAPRRLLVQWVPHAFGWRAMNLGFCLWLWWRAAFKGDDVRLMVHEPFLPFAGGSWKQAAAALVQRLMTVVLLRAASGGWVSSGAWEACLRPYTLGKRLRFTWLPVPSTIPVVPDRIGIEAIRARLVSAGGTLVGHFGTYGQGIAGQLLELAPLIFEEHPRRALLLLGRGGEKMRSRLVACHPSLTGRIHAAGELPADRLSLHLSACDLMLQPYPGGVDGRRTTVMAALAHGVPVVTTSGRLTEPLWAASGAVALAPDGDLPGLVRQVRRLLEDAEERKRLGAAGRSLYQKHFAVEHTVRALRTVDGPDAPTIQRRRACASLS